MNDFTNCQKKTQMTTPKMTPGNAGLRDRLADMICYAENYAHSQAFGVGERAEFFKDLAQAKSALASFDNGEGM